jgi:hypothetical protein
MIKLVTVVSIAYVFGYFLGAAVMYWILKNKGSNYERKNQSKNN